MGKPDPKVRQELGEGKEHKEREREREREETESRNTTGQFLQVER